MNARRLLVALALIVVAAVIVGSGWAFYIATSTAGSSGRARAAFLPTGNQPAVAVSGRDVTVSWAQNSVAALGGLLGAQAHGGYTITRYAENAPATAITPAATCSGTQTGNTDPLTCTESSLPTGRWKYTATPSYYNWIGGESSHSLHAIVAPVAPSTVTLANGGGVGGAYINAANHSNVVVDVALPPTSLSSDTVTLTASDGVPAHTVTKTAAATAGAGTVHFTAVDVSGLNDGTITFTAKSSSAYGDDSGNTSTTAPKDTVAPTVASVSLTGANLDLGTTYINATNKASLGFSVGWAVGPLNAATDTIAVTMSSSGGGTPVTATGARNANPRVFSTDATAMSDGMVTLTATATDVAGNTSSPVASGQSIVKDTIAPATPTSILITNGLGAGGAYINGVNKSSVNFNVGWSASPNNASTDTIGLALTSTATMTGTASRGASSPTVVSGIDAQTLADGTISATATATDLAGNTSAPFTNPNAAIKDTVAPTVSLSITSAGSAGISGTTISYKGNEATAANRTFQISATVADSGSGPASASFPAIAATGWTHDAEGPVTTPGGGVYTSSAFTWTASPSNPTGYAISFADLAGNQGSQAITFTSDTTGPVLQSIGTTTGGTISGRMETGDTVSFTFSEALNPASVPTSVTVKEDRHGGTTFTITAGIISGDSVGISNGYVTGNNTTATATGTVSLSNGNKTITITLGTVNVTQGGLATGTQGVTMTANGLLKDIAGNGATGSATVTPLF